MWSRPLTWAFKVQTWLPTRPAVQASIRRCTDSPVFPEQNPQACGFSTSDPFFVASGNAASSAVDSGSHLMGGSLRGHSTQARAASSASARADERKNESNAVNLVKLLRERTAVSMGLCKQALEASNWDMEEAVRYLRKAGVKRAVQTAHRDAREGLVAICSKEDGSSSSAVVLSCETDFVQRSPKFVAFAKALAEHYATLSVIGRGGIEPGLDMLKSSKPSSGLCSLAQCGVEAECNTVDELFPVLSSQFGEKVVVAAVERLEGTTSACIGAYVHNEIEAGAGRVAGLVQLSYKLTDPTKTTTPPRKLLTHFARLLAMQVVATKPKFISLSSIPPDFIQQERAVVEHAALKRASENVTEADLSKIVEKNLAQFLKEQSLLSQEFLMTMQMIRDILNADKTTSSADHAQCMQPLSVADALERVGQSVGCKLEVTHIRLLTGGNG